MSPLTKEQGEDLDARRERRRREQEERDRARGVVDPPFESDHRTPTAYEADKERKARIAASERVAKDDENRRQSRYAGRRRRAKGATRTVRRQVKRYGGAVPGTSVQLWHVAVVSLMMVALYLVLVHGKSVGGVIAYLEKAVAWLVSPTAVL